MANPAAPRYLEKFVDLAASVSYTFPLKAYQLDDSQPLRTAFQTIIGADYPVDLLGFGLAPKDAGRLTHRVYIVASSGAGVDSALDEMRHKLRAIGGGKLYTLDSSSAERWAYARLTNMPTTSWKAGDLNFIAAILEWTRLSNWYASSSYAMTFSIDADPKTITVANTGDDAVLNAILTLKNTFGPVTITNTTNGFEIDSTQVGADSDDWLKIDAGQGLVLFSADGGATYAGAFATVTLPTQQIQLMRLEPGNNTLVITGANGATLDVAFPIPFD